MKRIALAAGLVLALAACQGDNRSTRHLVPIPPATMALMDSKGMSKNDPILIRAYKKESEIEVWKRGSQRQVRPAQDLSDLPLVGPARAEDPRGRPSGAGGLLHDHARRR